MIDRKILLIAPLALALGLSCCSSDPEGPIMSVFTDGGPYKPRAGETVRHVDTLSAVSVFSVPVGIGESSFLRLGETEGIRFESILMKFDFDSLDYFSGKTVDSVYIVFPVRIVQDADFELEIVMNELLADFSEDDTITAEPPFSGEAIPGAAGETVRKIDFETAAFSLDESMGQGWIDGTAEPWPLGIVVRWNSEPDPMGIVEMYSQNYGTDPPVINVSFTDGSNTVFPASEDYNVASYAGSGLACVGGVATRIYFEFDLAGIHEDAMVNYSALVLHTDGEAGLGASAVELENSFTTDFIYYLYAPGTGDMLDKEFLSGTGVAAGSFVPTVSEEVRIPLGGFTRDLLAGARENLGLVLQSDLEAVRYQKALFYGIASGDSLKPYIEVIYSLPADFTGE